MCNQSSDTGVSAKPCAPERSRIVSINDPERNFHIFYQLCEGASEGERKELRLKSPKVHQLRIQLDP
jgi:myosin-5